MKLWGKVVALLLAVLWMPVSSHCLLETAELIHHDACCQPDFGGDHSHGHDAADGNCQVESRQLAVQKTDVLKACVLVALLSSAEFSNAGTSDGPLIAPSGVAPPELTTSWQFVSRTAVPPRAPSILL